MEIEWVFRDVPRRFDVILEEEGVDGVSTTDISDAEIGDSRTDSPTISPTGAPTASPTHDPTTADPTAQPTADPSAQPTAEPYNGCCYQFPN